VLHVGVTLAGLFVVLCCTLAASAYADIESPPTLDPFGQGDAVMNEGHALSWDGRFVVFSSYATNLVQGDNNGFADVFVWDRKEAEVLLVSRAENGDASNGDSFNAVISADGNWVAFASNATNLAADANGATTDVFLFHLSSGEISLVSQSSAGLQSSVAAANPDINANGRYVTFDAVGDLAPGSGTVVRNVFRRDIWLGETRRLSQTAGGAPNGNSMDAQMDAAGERIVFVSMATDLSATETVGKDVYLFDALAGTTELVTQTVGGAGGDGISYFPTISGNGQVVAFHSNANNLVAADRADVTDVVLRELSSERFELISKSTGGAVANDHNTHPALDFSGTRVAFRSDASNLIVGDTRGFGDVLIHDRPTATTTRLSQTVAGVGDNGEASAPSLSLDSGVVAFLSRGDELIPGGSMLADPLVAVGAASSGPVTALGSAVLPSSRSVQTGNAFTAFASVVGTQILDDCSLALAGDFAIAFDYQATDPRTNAPLGAVNEPFLIWPGQAQTFLLTLATDAVFTAQELSLVATCGALQAPAVVGLNTLLVTSQATRGADMVALAATQSDDGVVVLSNGVGAFSVATINLGSAANIVARPEAVGPSLDSLTICPTDPVTGNCTASAATRVELPVAAGATPTFAVFVANSAAVSFSPATTRVAVNFADSSGVVLGRTSVAVRSTP